LIIRPNQLLFAGAAVGLLVFLFPTKSEGNAIVLFIFILVVNLCFYFFVFIPALVLPFYSINYVWVIGLFGLCAG